MDDGSKCPKCEEGTMYYETKLTSGGHLEVWLQCSWCSYICEADELRPKRTTVTETQARL